jgi:predicted metal-dependent phosphoesterase TrpH
MKIRIDLHVHTNYSKDSVTDVNTVVKRIKEQGLDGYAICDHDTIRGIPEALNKREDLIVIPATEITAKNAHIIAIDPNELIPPNQSIIETVEQIHEQGATAVLAHPFCLPKSWVKITETKKANLDAIEVANSMQMPYNMICKLSQRLANKLDLPATGGSDSHIPETIGNAFTIIETKSTEISDVVKAIQNGNTNYEGRGTGLYLRLKKIILNKKNKG